MRVERKRGDIADAQRKIKNLTSLLSHEGWKILQEELQLGLKAKDEQLKSALRSKAMGQQLDGQQMSPEYLIGFADAYQHILLLPLSLIADYDSQAAKRR